MEVFIPWNSPTETIFSVLWEIIVSTKDDPERGNPIINKWFSLLKFFNSLKLSSNLILSNLFEIIFW